MKKKFIFSCFKNSYVWNIPNEKNVKDLQTNRNCWLQFAAVISVSMISAGTGAFEMWIQPALPHLKGENFKFKVMEGQVSWIVSLYNVGEIIGFLLHPLFINRIGRKYTLLVSAIPQILASVLLFTAENVTTLYAARIIGGCGFGAGTIVQNFYVNEIAEKNIRGILASISGLGFLIGVISILVSGPFLSYDYMNLMILLFPLIFIATFAFMPESPYFYLKYNRDEEAIKCLSKLRGIKNSKILDLEISQIKETIAEDEKYQKFALRNLFENKRHRKAFIIVSILKVAGMFSGAKVIAAYFHIVFNYTGLFLDSQYIALIMAPIVAILIIPTIILVDYIGRKFMILCSGITCSSSLLIVGFFFFWKDHINSNDISLFSWIPLIALIVLDIGCIALLATTNVLSGELFSLQIKSTALALLFGNSQVLEFVIKLSFERIIELIGIYGIFWVYSILCIVLSIIGFYITPETKGKTLQEIQLLLD